MGEATKREFAETISVAIAVALKQQVAATPALASIPSIETASGDVAT